MGCTSSSPQEEWGARRQKRLKQEGPSLPLLFGSCSTQGQSQSFVMKYKMFVLPVATVMQMEKLEPHQLLLQKNQLKEWTDDMEGRVIFVSHQWLGFHHPDPEGKHFWMLKQLLGRLVAGRLSVEESWRGQLISQNNCTVRGEQWAAALPHMFLWMDFTGIPNLQLGDKVSHSYSAAPALSDPSVVSVTSDPLQLKADWENAVSSIPAYIERSSLMLVLVPPCQHADSGEACNFSTWRRRGWCRFEFMAAHLSRNNIKVMIHQGCTPFFNFPIDALTLPPGQGIFSCCQHNHMINGEVIPCDKANLHSVLEGTLRRKIRQLRSIGQKEKALFYAAVSHRFTQGLISETLCNNDCNNDCSTVRNNGKKKSFGAVQRLKIRLGWEAADEVSSQASGWSLLLLACMADDVYAVRELVQVRQDINVGLSRSWPELYCAPKGFTPLMAAMAWSRFEVVAELLQAKASPETVDADGRGLDALAVACVFGRADNVSCWLERFPESDLEQRERSVGATRLHAAAAYPTESSPCLKVLLEARADVHSGAQAGYNALKFVTQKDDSDADAVQLLLDAGIEVNRPSRPSTVTWKCLLLACRMAHRLNKTSSLVDALAEGPGSTALHLAYANGHCEIIKKLQQAGADEEVCNLLGQKPRDMIRGVSP